MVATPGSKFRRFGAFKAFDRPISPIAALPTDDPAWFLKVNEDYMPIVNGAIGALARPETWDTTSEESSLEATQTGHEIMDLWKPWSEHITVPDWELVNQEPGHAHAVMNVRGENATGPMYLYCFVQTTTHHFKFRDITTLAWVGGLLTVARCYQEPPGLDWITGIVTPCAGLPQNTLRMGSIDFVDFMGGAFLCREIEVFTDASYLLWQFVLKNNWQCGDV